MPHARPPCTLHPASCILHPAPCTLHPARKQVGTPGTPADAAFDGVAAHHACQNLSLLSFELHVRTREQLLPDPGCAATPAADAAEPAAAAAPAGGAAGAAGASGAAGAAGAAGSGMGGFPGDEILAVVYAVQREHVGAGSASAAPPPTITYGLILRTDDQLGPFAEPPAAAPDTACAGAGAGAGAAGAAGAVPASQPGVAARTARRVCGLLRGQVRPQDVMLVGSEVELLRQVSARWG